MASFTFNVAKGREVEFHKRVNDNDPSTSALIAIVLAEAALESDDLLRDYDTVDALLAGASNEATNSVRKTLTDAELAVETIDDSLDRVTLPFPTLTYTTPAAGDAWRKLILAYDADTGAGTDANLIPVTAHDLLINGAAIVPTGVNIVISSSAGYLVAT